MIKYFAIMLKNKFLFFLSLVFIYGFLFINNTFAVVNKLSFITDIQTLDVGQVSNSIKVQTEDQNGTTTTANETIYLNLSTSGDGEFSSNGSNWKAIATLQNNFSTSSIYISSSSASRTFYYKGLSSGQHKITVSAKSKSGIVFGDIDQIVNIGIISTSTSGSENNSESTTSTTSTSTTTPNTSSQNTRVITRTVYVSTHSGEEDLSNYEEKNAFQISAGRERLASVGSPVEFDSKYTLLQSGQCLANFKWSFGDGFDATGKDVKHTYKYPGEYQVILNGDCGN